MPDKTVYRATAKAQKELAGGKSALPAALQRLLELVDGKTAVGVLKSKLGRIDEAKVNEAFKYLEKSGYIEAMKATGPEPITLDFTMAAPPRPAAGTPPISPSPAMPPAAPAAPIGEAARAAAQPAAKMDFSDAAPQPAAKVDFSGAAPQPAAKVDFSGAAPQPAAKLDFSDPAPQPSAAKIAEAEQLTLAGMRTLKAAGYYVNILSKPGIQHPPRSGSQYTVLILDDDKMNALLVARALMAANFGVRSAETRDDAQTELKKVPLPDAIVLNPHMPNLNGLDLLARLQAHKYYSSVPIIVITGDLAHDTVVDALARGAAGYLTKPFKPPALLDTVRAVLGLN